METGVLSSPMQISSGHKTVLAGSRSKAFPATAVVEADDPAVFQAIHSRKVVLAVWRRTLASALLDELAAAGFGDWPTIRVEAKATNVCDALSTEARPEAGSHFAPLFEDVGRLSEAFARVFEVERVRVRLEAVDRDMCRLFHADYVPARLITTYRGPTTEYLAPGDYEPRALGKGDNDRIVTDWSRVRSLPRHAVGIFKGCGPSNGTPGRRGRGCVHRSPPVEPTGRRRLLLCIDLERPAI